MTPRMHLLIKDNDIKCTLNHLVHVVAVFLLYEMHNWFVIFLTRARNCLPTSTRTLKREMCQMRTVLMKWRMTASWWTEMYVTCLVFSSLHLSIFHLPEAGFVSLCPADVWGIAHAVADGSCSNQAAVMEYSPLPSYCLCCLAPMRLSLLGATASLSLCRFVLISSSSLFSVCPLFFSSTLSKWKVL